MTCLIVVTTILTCCETVVSRLYSTLYRFSKSRICRLVGILLSLCKIGIAIDKLRVTELNGLGSYIRRSYTTCYR